jgi:predicted ribosomally synthesized peptide with nif11-like leader
MSEEAAQAFLEEMKSDEAFRDRVLAVGDPAQRVRLINDEGFDCSAEEIEAQGRRLDDPELDEVVAAGYDCPCLNDAIHGQPYAG